MSARKLKRLSKQPFVNEVRGLLNFGEDSGERYPVRVFDDGDVTGLKWRMGRISPVPYRNFEQVVFYSNGEKPGIKRELLLEGKKERTVPITAGWSDGVALYAAALQDVPENPLVGKLQVILVERYAILRSTFPVIGEMINMRRGELVDLVTTRPIEL